MGLDRVSLCLRRDFATEQNGRKTGGGDPCLLGEFFWLTFPSGLSFCPKKLPETLFSRTPNPHSTYK
jgi:hypothetical protein